MKGSVKVWIGIGVLATALFTAGPGRTAEEATPQEVMAKVNQAVTFLEQNGNAGLAEFNDSKSQWVWKNTYLVVQDCAGGQLAGHPIKPKLVGMTLDKMIDIKGNAFGFGCCEAANAPKGAWYEYWWPKPGEKTPSRKVAYNMKVKGTGLMVSGGIYDENQSLDSLNKMIH